MQLSIIILNYNTSLLTLKCIDTINYFLQKKSYEIIVVDNNSTREEYSLLEKNLIASNIKLIRSCLNTGFGAGNMLGANFAKGKYLCFINSDVELREDCMTPLCEYLENHPDVGCITPQQYNKDNKLVPSFNHKPGIRHEILGKNILEKIFPQKYPKRKNTLYNAPFKASQINGVFMLFPKSVFFEIGGFDINIFLYYEEYDICTRLYKKGLHSVVMPEYSFMHIHEASTSKIKSLTRKELYISKLYTYKKHNSYFSFVLYKWINLLKLLFHTKRWYILPVVFKSESLSYSMRHHFFY